MAKNSSLPVTGLGSRGPLKDLKDSKLILNESKLFPWSSRISLVPFRTFRGPLFPKPVTGQELFFAISYSKLALTSAWLVAETTLSSAITNLTKAQWTTFCASTVCRSQFDNLIYVVRDLFLLFQGNNQGWECQQPSILQKKTIKSYLDHQMSEKCFDLLMDRF